MIKILFEKIKKDKLSRHFKVILNLTISSEIKFDKKYTEAQQNR